MPGIPTLTPYRLPVATELPENTAQWRLDPSRAVVLVHDMQEYFLRPFEDSFRQALIENVSRVRAWAVAQDVPVAYTAQPGAMDATQRGLLADFWGPGMSAQDEDRSVVSALSPNRQDWVITKWRYSAFFRSNLLQRMRDTHRDQLVLCGVYAHVGVLMSAVDAYTNDIQPFLVADAIGDFDQAFHKMAIQYAADRCAMVISTTEATS